MRIMLLEGTRGILGVLSIPLLFPLPLLAAVYVTRWVLGEDGALVSPLWASYLVCVFLFILFLIVGGAIEAGTKKLYSRKWTGLTVSFVIEILIAAAILRLVVAPLLAAAIAGLLGVSLEFAIFRGLAPLWKHLEAEADKHSATKS